jgi:hypothetical protein
VRRCVPFAVTNVSGFMPSLSCLPRGSCLPQTATRPLRMPLLTPPALPRQTRKQATRRLPYYPRQASQRHSARALQRRGGGCPLAPQPDLTYLASAKTVASRGCCGGASKPEPQPRLLQTMRLLTAPLPVAVAVAASSQGLVTTRTALSRRLSPSRVSSLASCVQVRRTRRLYSRPARCLSPPPGSPYRPSSCRHACIRPRPQVRPTRPRRCRLCAHLGRVAADAALHDDGPRAVPCETAWEGRG